MAAKPNPESELIEALRAYERAGSKAGAARELGLAVETLKSRIKAAERRGLRVENEMVEVPTLPADDLPIEDLVEMRKRQFAAKRAHEEARQLIPVTVKQSGPLGLLLMGDPHVDDDGTDLALLERHSDLTHEPGILGASVGDVTNNWVGRLARLYADQSTGSRQAWRLAEWFVRRTRWLFLIGGNHDAWSGEADPLRWISRQAGAMYEPSECRIGLQFPGGREIIINARHDFAGSSQWNPAHGQMKAIQMGLRDHLSVSGHKHTSGYGVLKDPGTGRTCHALQIASYKVFDRYARERGFRDQALGPAAFVVIDPALTDDHPDLLKIYWDPEEGAEFLRWKRRRAA